ncbi:MAG: beta-N-acetylhexosaminidase [Desulfobacteraceae bacterium]|nr:MAG: beta-N-acetylhexosaminidase [Desulfobacteraceae bacterium]
MDLGKEIGQLFMCGMPGTVLDDETQRIIRDYNPGGVILFARNIEGPLQVAGLCRDLQKAALGYHGTPLFLAVDQEGGRVARLREPFTSFPGNSAIGADEQPVEKAVAFGRTTATEMKLVGLNMDLAPVVDVRRGEIERHLDGRSFGEDPEMVALLGRAVIQSLQANGIMAVAKHFPGLGRADLDPHFHLPRIGIDVGELMSVNMPPFIAAIEAGVSGIMTSHAVYPSLDGDRPATLSSSIMTKLLRKELGFEGLLLSDDLEMGAIAATWGVAEGAAAAFAAGADLLLVCKEQSLAEQSAKEIGKRIDSGAIPLYRLEESLARIRKAKTRFLSDMRGVSFAEIEKYFGLEPKQRDEK